MATSAIKTLIECEKNDIRKNNIENKYIKLFFLE
jgi:hypothetical protein